MMVYLSLGPLYVHVARAVARTWICMLPGLEIYCLGLGMLMFLGLSTCSLYFGCYGCQGWEWSCARAGVIHVAWHSGVHVDSLGYSLG